jgi:hypothetical protein
MFSILLLDFVRRRVFILYTIMTTKYTYYFNSFFETNRLFENYSLSRKRAEHVRVLCGSNMATIEVGKNYDAPVIDMYSQFKDKEEYFADESHFNEKGHRLAAEIIFNQINPLLIK